MALVGPLLPTKFNSLRLRQNGRHFTDDVFKCIFLNENVWILLKIPLKFVSKGPINNIPALVQIMACRRSGGKPLSEPMMASWLTHICVALPQWVKQWINNHSHVKLWHVMAHPYPNINGGVAKMHFKVRAGMSNYIPHKTTCNYISMAEFWFLSTNKVSPWFKSSLVVLCIRILYAIPSFYEKFIGINLMLFAWIFLYKYQITWYFEVRIITNMYLCICLKSLFMFIQVTKYWHT